MDVCIVGVLLIVVLSMSVPIVLQAQDSNALYGSL